MRVLDAAFRLSQQGGTERCTSRVLRRGGRHRLGHGWTSRAAASQDPGAAVTPLPVSVSHARVRGVDPRVAAVLVEAAMRSIGHELQHALEVLSNPTVRNLGQMFQLYDRICNQCGDRLRPMRRSWQAILTRAAPLRRSCPTQTAWRPCPGAASARWIASPATPGRSRS